MIGSDGPVSNPDQDQRPVDQRILAKMLVDPIEQRAALKIWENLRRIMMRELESLRKVLCVRHRPIQLWKRDVDAVGDDDASRFPLYHTGLLATSCVYSTGSITRKGLATGGGPPGLPLATIAR